MKAIFLVTVIVVFAGLSSAQTCGGNLTLVLDGTVQVTSPGHPDQYPNNANCLWRVHATDLSSLVLSCPEVETQYNLGGCVDTISFSDATNFNQLPSYCGNKKPPAELVFGDTVFIQFLSDARGTNTGFICNIKAIQQDIDRTCECGKANSFIQKTPVDKIYNGVATKKHEFPWLGLVMTFDATPKVLCGAAVINSHYVLTSARCVIGIHPGDIEIRLGEHDLLNNNESPPHKIYDIEEIKIHPEFNSSNLANDLALVRVVEQINFATNIRPACLPQGVMDLTKAPVTVAGWGQIKAGGAEQTLPHTSTLDVEPTLEVCNAMLPPVLAIGEGQFCTTSKTGADVCAGDFGGPIFQPIDGVNYLAGISSFNTACGLPDVPTVHSRIDYNLAWIQGASNDAMLCGTTLNRNQNIN